MSMVEGVPGEKRSGLLGFRRGLARRCPNCGKGHLFSGYLAVQPTCEVCGADNSLYRADDGPAYFTILIIGHLVVAPLLCLGFLWTLSTWVLVPMLLSIVAVATLSLLPVVKGGFIGAQWAMGGIGAQ